MGDDHWFRNSDWNDEIAAAFQARLKRARQKFQYLRIQAGYLAQSAPTVALALLDQYFDLGEHPDAAQAWVEVAVARRALGDAEGAVSAYWAALDCERCLPGFRTQACFELAVFVVINRIQSEYAKVLTLLDERIGQDAFPVERYRAEGARALLLQHFGRGEEAKIAAQRAAVAAAETQSEFSHHPNLGLVSDADGALGARIAELLT